MLIKPHHRLYACFFLFSAITGAFYSRLPDIQRAWADPGRHGDFVWAGVVMALLGVAALFIGRQRTGHLWLRTCPEWTGDEHSCRQDECPVQRRREHEDAPQPLLRLWFIGPVVLALAAAVLGLAGADVALDRLAAFCALPLAVGGLSLLLRARWGDRAEEHRPQRPLRRRSRPSSLSSRKRHRLPPPRPRSLRRRPT